MFKKQLFRNLIVEYKTYFFNVLNIDFIVMYWNIKRSNKKNKKYYENIFLFKTLGCSV